MTRRKDRHAALIRIFKIALYNLLGKGLAYF